MLCQHCFTADMEIPANNHPAYLVCPNCAAIELTYEPMDYQEALHTVPIQLNEDGTPHPQIIFVAGGYGSGKSRASLQEFLLRCLENPRGTGAVIAPTLGQLKRTTLKTFFNEICPPMLIKRYNKSEGEIELENGFIIYTLAADDETKLRSLNLGVIHVEEISGIDKSIFVQLLTRMRDPFTKIKTLFACTNPDGGWVRETFAMNEARKDPKHPEHADYNPFISAHIWPTHLNKHLPANFIELTAAGRPEWWVKKYLQGSFDHVEGAVYPNASSTIIDPFEIPKHWERLIGADFGLRNPTALPFLAIDDQEGIVYAYDEYYVAGKTVSEHAPHIKAKLDQIPHGRLRPMVGDPSGKNRNPVNGKSIIGLYAEYDIFFQPGNNQLEAGILKVNSYINRGRLKIFSTCVNLLRELINYKFPELDIDEDENLDERPEKRHDHMPDALRYAIMTLPDDPDLLKAKAYEPPSRYGRKTVVEDDDWEDEEAKDWTAYI